MVDRMYRICLTVPLGSRMGTMLLREAEGKIDGWLSVMNEKNSLCGVLSSKGQLAVSGMIRTLVSTMHYTATGAIVGHRVFMNLKTDAGTYYPLTGEEYSIDD